MLGVGSDFVARLKKSGSGPNIDVCETQALTQQDIDAAGVLSDQIVTLPGSRGSPGFGPSSSSGSSPSGTRSAAKRSGC